MDIPDLAWYYLEKYSNKYNKNIIRCFKNELIYGSFFFVTFCSTITLCTSDAKSCFLASFWAAADLGSRPVPVSAFLIKYFFLKLPEKLQNENGIECAEANILVSGGAKHSISNVFLTLLNPGDEVIIYAPYWVSYIDMVKLAEGVPVIIEGGIDQDFKASAAQLEVAITDKTKAIIFSSPCNPSGAVFSKDELSGIANVVLNNENIMVIADEIYEYTNFSGKHESIATLPGMFEKTVTVNGFSKGYAMTGWRVGYICAPEWLVKAVHKLQGHTTSGICSIAQRAAIAAITGDMTPTRNMTKAYQRRQKLVLDLLADIPGVKANKPQGAFYVFPDISEFFGKSDGETTIHDANDLALYILGKAHVSIVSGAAFGSPHCIRISYAASEEDLKTALLKIKNVLAQLN